MQLDDHTDAPPAMSEPAAGPRSRWFALLGIGFVVAIAVLAAGELSRPNEPVYHAEALVVANELAIRVESLPRTAVAIFNSSGVAELAATLAGTEVDPDYLFREVVSAEPVENTYIIEVDAIHADPELAAVYANAAGEALAQELNRIGAGLGSFALQAPADIPDSPVPAGRRQLAIAALIAGTAAAMSIAALSSLRSWADPVRDQQHQPTASNPSEGVDSFVSSDSTIRVTPVEKGEGTDASTEDRDTEPGQPQSTGVTEDPDHGSNRWISALRDIKGPGPSEPTEPAQHALGNAEPGTSALAGQANSPGNAAPTRGEKHRPQPPGHSGSDVATRPNPVAPDIIIDLDGTNPPAT